MFSVATFEYTAPGVDPKFRSLHNITNLNDFNRVQSWKQKEDPQNGNADMQPVIEGTHEGTPDEEQDNSPDVAREGTTTTNELQVATAQHSSSATGCPRLSLDGEPFMFDKERGTSGGGPLPSAGIQARAVSLDERRYLIAAESQMKLQIPTICLIFSYLLSLRLQSTRTD